MLSRLTRSVPDPWLHILTRSLSNAALIETLRKDAPALRLCSLEDTRGVLRLTGEKVTSFLQGLLANDVHNLEEQMGSTIYAPLLSPKGRVLHDVILHRSLKSPHHQIHPLMMPTDQRKQLGMSEHVDWCILMDSDRRTLDDLIQRLKMYRLKSMVEIEDVSTQNRVCCLFGQTELKRLHGLDPRLPSLGYRFIVPVNSIERGSLVDAAEYQRWRLVRGVAEGRSEIPVDAIPLEYNMVALNGLSLSKGCYLGQELIARTHFQGTIRKRVFPVTLVPPPPFSAEGLAIILEDENRKIGHVCATCQGAALALLRVAAALDAKRQGRRLVLSETEVEVQVSIPGWWPGSWLE